MPDNVQHIFGLSDEDVAGVPETGDAPHTPETQPDQAPEAVDTQPQDGPDKGHPDTDVGAQQQGHPGQKLWAGKYQTPEDLERSYEELQRKLGEQGQQLGTLQQQYQQLLAYLQQTQAVQGYQQPVAQHPAQKLREPEPAMSPDEFLNKLESEGPKVVEQVAERVARRILEQEGQVIGQGLGQILGPMYQYYIQSQLRGHLQGQINSLKSKYQDFDEYRRDLFEIVKEQPALVAQPGGLELAYLAAKARKGQAVQQQVPQTAALQQAMNVTKKAAQMPSPTAGNAHRQQTKLPPEEAIKRQIFGDPGQTQGIFG